MFRNKASLGSRIVLILFLACLLLFSSLGYFLFYGRNEFERNFIGVIRIEGPITSPETSSFITNALNKGIFNSSIKAVVIMIDSPGGFAHLIEQIYLDVIELKQRKPVLSYAVTASLTELRS